MGPMRLMGPMGLMGLMGLMGMGCSSEDDEGIIPMEVMGVVTQYEEISEANGGSGTTRAWTLPSGYSQMVGNGQSIGMFLTQNGVEPLQGFSYSGGGKWHTSLEIEHAGTYYFYGYTPHTSGVTCTISSSSTDNDNSSYSTGAVLKINNLPAVTANDVCVIIGAKNGKDDYKADDDYTVSGLVRGNFEYAAQPTEGGSGNYIYLLLDHLYAALRVNMRVNGDYNALRTIKLKELRLQTSASGTATKKRLNATVTLAATSGDPDPDPIQSIVYTPVGEDDGDGSMFSSTNGVTLTTSYGEYMGHFMPQGVDKLKLTSVYDVYDKKGNLIRESCMATNTLILKELFSEQNESRRGCRYTIKMTIQPTYLYVLSEPDLDDPTVTLDKE